MCATTAAGRGRSSRARAASKRNPRPAFVRERKRWTRQFAGSDALDRAVGEHDDLVDAGGERADLRHRRPEHRARRIDLLRHEHELHEPTTASTSSRTRCAYSSGRRQPAGRPCGARRRRAARRARGRTRIADERVGERGGVLGRHEQARCRRRSTMSGMPPARAPDDGAAAAERLDDDPRPSPSERDGEHERGRLVHRARDLRRRQRLPSRTRGPGTRRRAARATSRIVPRPTS